MRRVVANATAGQASVAIMPARTTPGVIGWIDTAATGSASRNATNPVIDVATISRANSLGS